MGADHAYSLQDQRVPLERHVNFGGFFANRGWRGDSYLLSSHRNGETNGPFDRGGNLLDELVTLPWSLKDEIAAHRFAD
jgi:hypothetical protein